jgi:hypothetical protein
LGGTSGRFGVAGLVARYFPAYRQFLLDVIAEKIEPESYFPTGPFPADALVSHQSEIVEYITPPHKKGLGTAIWLAPDAEPILSAAMLTRGDPLDTTIVNIRLPSDMADLETVLLRAAEHRVRYCDVQDCFH